MVSDDVHSKSVLDVHPKDGHPAGTRHRRREDTLPLLHGGAEHTDRHGGSEFSMVDLPAQQDQPVRSTQSAGLLTNKTTSKKPPPSANSYQAMKEKRNMSLGLMAAVPFRRSKQRLSVLLPEASTTPIPTKDKKAQECVMTNQGFGSIPSSVEQQVNARQLKTLTSYEASAADDDGSLFKKTRHCFGPTEGDNGHPYDQPDSISGGPISLCTNDAMKDCFDLPKPCSDEDSLVFRPQSRTNKSKK